MPLLQRIGFPVLDTDYDMCKILCEVETPTGREQDDILKKLSTPGEPHIHVSGQTTVEGLLSSLPFFQAPQLQKQMISEMKSTVHAKKGSEDNFGSVHCCIPGMG